MIVRARVHGDGAVGDVLRVGDDEHGRLRRVPRSAERLERLALEREDDGIDAPSAASSSESAASTSKPSSCVSSR